VAVGVEPGGDRPQRQTFGPQLGHDRGQVGVRFVGYRERLWWLACDVLGGVVV
jgi:hypothetical protein